MFKIEKHELTSKDYNEKATTTKDSSSSEPLGSAAEVIVKKK